jgi:hypothetical protein
LDHIGVSASHLKHKLWDDSLGHLELIDFEIAKEAEDARLEPPKPFTMADLDMPLVTNVEDDEITDDGSDSSIYKLSMSFGFGRT